MNSSLYLELSKEELRKLISKTLNTDINSAKLLTGGLFNTTYYIDTMKYGSVVLRAGPVNRHLLLPFEHSLMQAEQLVYKLCREAQVPVSEILFMDTSKRIIDCDYMIVRYIPSVPMNEAVLCSDNNSQICRDIGAATAKMHSITHSHFGQIVDVENGKGFSKWSDCLLHELNQWERLSKSTSLFSDAEYIKIRRTFENSIPFLDKIQTPSLVHTDLWKGNVLICFNSDIPEFAAIIDADRAMWGDPDVEFSSINWTHSEPTFWEGYGKALKQDFGSRIRRTIYTLLWSLLDAYVYLQEYNQPENANERKIKALHQIDILSTLLHIK